MDVPTYASAAAMVFRSLLLPSISMRTLLIKFFVATRIIYGIQIPHILPKDISSSSVTVATGTDRRSFLVTAALSTTVSTAAAAVDSPAPDDRTTAIVTLPLERCGGGTVCVRVTVASDENDDGGYYRSFFEVYRAVVDTGSPYLVVPATDAPPSPSRRPRWWFSRDAQPSTASLRESGYAPTEEIYGARSGTISWRRARAILPRRSGDGDARLTIGGFYHDADADKDSSATTTASTTTTAARDDATTVIGVMDAGLAEESGGPLFGLIRSSNAESTRISRRPTLLEQTRIVRNDDDDDDDADGFSLVPTSFTLDVPNLTLTLSNRSLLPSASAVMPLVDLRRYGDFVDHYAVLVRRLSINDAPVDLPTDRDVVAVFDSGLTGCLLKRPFWDELVERGIVVENDDGDGGGNGVRALELDLATEEPKRRRRRGERSSHRPSGSSRATVRSDVDSSPRRFYVDPVSLDWFDDNDEARNGPPPHVVVLGQTFLERGSLTIDAEERRAVLFATAR